MQLGNLFRQRRVKSYGDDGRSFIEVVADEEKTADLKKVFVTMLLGVEHQQICTKKGKPVMAPLDAKRALNDLGYWGEDQIIEALGESGLKRLIAVQEENHAKKKRRIELKRKYDRELPMLDKLLGGEKLWFVRGPASNQKSQIKLIVSKLKEEHEYLLDNEPKDEYHACVILGAINMAEGLLV